MILIFGPAGSGKSLHGQMLSARFSWRWLSAGQLLRDMKSHEISKVQHSGALVDNSIVNDLVARAIKKGHAEVDKIILDGYPREISQAEWLISQDYSIGIVIVINVPRHELLKRLHVRGRADDADMSAIEERFNIYQKDIKAIRGLFEEHGVRIIDIDGHGTVGEVHDRIVKELEKCKLV